jgi:hypothetical protein
MVDTARAPSGFATWEPLVRQRFQPSIHTRVGGVCLFAESSMPTAEGMATLTQAKLLTNLHAKAHLPAWIDSAIEAAGAKYKAIRRAADMPQQSG